MSDKAETEAKPKKGMSLMAKALLGLTLIGAGGGGVFGLMAAGVIPGGGQSEKEDNKPKLIRKGEVDPFAPPQEGGKDGEQPAVDGDGGSEYRKTYYSFADDFTSNMRNSEALLQVSLACSTRHDGRVLIWLKKHELAIRSALLAVIADTPEEDVLSIDGKERLQKRLTAAINKVLVETEGFGGVDAVYFKSFIIQ